MASVMVDYVYPKIDYDVKSAKIAPRNTWAQDAFTSIETVWGGGGDTKMICSRLARAITEKRLIPSSISEYQNHRCSSQIDRHQHYLISKSSEKNTLFWLFDVYSSK